MIFFCIFDQIYSFDEETSLKNIKILLIPNFWMAVYVSATKVEISVSVQ